MLRKISHILALVLGILAIILAQFSLPTLFSADGYLHIRMAQFLRNLGPHYDFHWARFSTFAGHFADKDFLYHLLLIPFTFFSDIFFGAKISAIVFSIFLFFVFYFILRRYCLLRSLIPLFLLLFVCSGSFLQWLSQPRNMLFTIALILLFTHFVIHKKYWPVFCVTVVYALSHVSAPYLLLFVLLAELVRFADERKICKENIAMVIFGLAVGLVLHPNFPNNLLVFYLNGILVSIFALKWGLELGAEFFPIGTRDYVLAYPFLFIGLVIVLILSLSSQTKFRLATKIWMAISGFFFVFSFFSQRYLVYSYPLVLVSLSAYLSDWWLSAPRLVWLKNKKSLWISSGIASIILFLLLGFYVYRDFRSRIQGEYVYNKHYEAAGNWMAKNIPAGELIFHANWSDSQFFIGLNPKNDYFVTLDPIYMYYWNPKIYNLYRQIAFGSTNDPYTLLRRVFGARFGYASRNYFSGLIAQVKQDARFEVLAEDYLGVIFRLK